MSGSIEGIAIVGMAGRFPGADSVDAWWQDLLDGRESLKRFRADELSPWVAREQREHPRYVPVRGVIADAERFDASFFGISAREARLMDPQQRVFLELCWNALENAAVDTERFPGTVGVFAGTSNNQYRKLLESQPKLLHAVGEFATMLANEKDYVATRVAHKLNLTGPALSIHTACSTSLVAVAQAWYALMSWQCDLALAGGINIMVPQESGYIPVEGGMESEDGHCRPFDAKANGTVFSSGGAVVALKRAEDAVADGDTIYAVIRGVGVNNDGGDKASFSAPSVRGQAAAIRQAMATAGAEADSIGYVEAHGTGTPLGDPIEVDALTRAFRQDTQACGFCRLGSVKGNVGHLNAASGVTGLIKTALALHHGRIPATLHFSTPNPEIDFASSPFTVVDTAVDWPRSGVPRRAGVSSFGVGGTNAHAVLEEAPLEAPATAASGSSRSFTLLPLSAHDEEAFARRAANLEAALAQSPDTRLADVGYTLALGRRPLTQRAAVVAADIATARKQCETLRPVATDADTNLVWLFPGQGSQHANMARELVTSEPVFGKAFERCCRLASSHLDCDLRVLIQPAAGDEEAAAAALAETRYTQPALFAVEYALAELWASWGLQPEAMIGHSIGEYVAATRAGVFTLEDAVKLVVARGAVMFAQPPGAMLAVRAGAAEVQARLPQGVEISGYNTPELTIVSGAHEAITAFADALDKGGIANTRLRVSHAFHSASMEGALEPFRAAFEGVTLNAPDAVFYSCVSGAPITAEQATSVDYWCQQIRRPVRFADALQHAAGQGWTLCLELGPSQALTGLARTMLGKQGKSQPVLGPAARPGNAAEHVTRALAACWCHGRAPDWYAYYADTALRRIPLPGYPFHGKRYWIEPEVTASPDATGENMTMQEPTVSAALPSAAPVRAPRLAAELREMFENLSGERIGAEQDGASFLDLGFDSLALTQAALEIERGYGLKLKFRRLLEDLDSIEKLVTLLDRELPPEAAPAVAEPAPIPAAAAVAATSPAAPTVADHPALTQLIQSQMALMAQQTELLRTLAGGAAPAVSSAVAVPKSVDAPRPVSDDMEADVPANLEERPFGAAARIARRRHGELTTAQQGWLARFVERYVQRTAKSRAFSQDQRALMADPRVVTGFDPRWKELVYPIVVERSAGARMWDLDGNEYIDLLNSFGVNFLGYQPDYVTNAVREQIEAGYEIGPQHPLAAEVSQLISEMTGMPRVAMCNTGSEAVMGAMRIARTVTGRDTIVIFKDSYHGIFDEVIVRGTRSLRSIAAAPGILANAVENVLVLEYGSDEALRVIRERAGELAAVMIEPIQSRNPTLQPRAFIRELRSICDDGGCALIFDEVITGFRVAQGGAQEMYGVRADIATYGKIIGGGLPLAAIAGKQKWLDALDGGFWRFGDESYPEAGVTYFAGTFVRHPLALAAGRAALQHVKQRGPQLQQALNARTEAMVARLNTFFAACNAPIDAICASSLWRTRVDADQPCASLFYYALRERGLHVYEQFNFFLSEAHGDAEVDAIFERIAAVTRELLDAGVLTPRAEAHVATIDAPAAITSHKRESKLVEDSTTSLPDRVPLTDVQREKWFGSQYSDSDVAAFNESMALEFRGTFDPGVFKQAFDMVVRRHEVFAMRFADDGSGQTLGPPCEIPLEDVDLSASDDPKAALRRFCAEQAEIGFDTAKPPLLRAQLLKLATDHHVMLVTAHHIIMDGWGWSVFNTELATCYNALRAGHSPELPAADSWRRFVLFERACREGEKGAQSLSWWCSQYANMPEPMAWPTDRPRAVTMTYAGASHAQHFDTALIDELSAAARRCKSTLFSFMLSGFYALIHRLTGQQDLVCGVPFAGQTVNDYKQVIGDSDNTLPLRLAVNAEESFAALVARTQRALLDASDHQHASLSNIFKALKLPANGTQLLLAEVMFNFNPSSANIEFDGMQCREMEIAKSFVNSELAFHFNEHADGLDLLVHYNRDLYDHDTVRRWTQYLCTILRQAAARPDTRVDDFELMDAEEYDQVVRQWNDTAVDFDRTQSLTALIAEQMQRTPDRVAAQCRNDEIDYATLDRSSRAVALELGRRGVGRGVMVGVCMPRSLDMLIAVLGVLRSGAAYVPLDPRFPAERLQYMAGHSRLRHVLVTDAEVVPPSVAEGRMLLAVGDLVATTRTADELPVVDGNDPAYVLYTSGSTGKPKGVRILHRNLVNFLSSMREAPGFGADDVLCATTTLSFDIAGLELYLPLITGARMVIATEEELRETRPLWDLIENKGCNVLQTTPSLLRLLMDTDRKDAVRHLRLFVGGEALPLAVANDMTSRCRAFWNLYGPTETTIWSTVARIEPGISVVPLGKPIANTQIYVLDGRGRPVPPGVVGAIWIGGDGVADGYLFRPDLTGERFVPDPFIGGDARMYCTGDLGTWRDGTLYFHGRADHQIKIRGYRIEPGDIEAAAETDPAVHECVVVAHRFGENDLRLVLYAAANGDRTQLARHLREHLRERLPDYMRPQHIELLDSLPKTPNGKIDRKALPEPVAARMVQAIAPRPVEPQVEISDPRQAGIAAIWREMIGVDDVQPEDNFFDLGGHSLLAVEFATRVQRDHGTRLRLMDIATGTLASLATELPERPLGQTAEQTADTKGSLITRLRKRLRLR